MAYPSTTTCFSFHTDTALFLSVVGITLLLSVASASVSASAHVFTVGGSAGWTVPSARDPSFYNRWATRNHFHVGDTLHFLNEADSVLVVSAIDDYMQCNITDPIQQLPASGNSTMFQFTRLGYYYFISGDVDHCLAGQRMIVCVTLHPHPDSISLLLPLVPSSLSAAIGPSAYYDIEPTSSLSVRLYSGTRYHNVSSPVKVCAGYGSLSAIGAFLIVGF